MACTLALAHHYNWRAGGELLNSESSRRLLSVYRRYLGPIHTIDGVFAPYKNGEVPGDQLIGNQLQRVMYPGLEAIIFNFSYRFALR